jgi:hypothetical protein
MAAPIVAKIGRDRKVLRRPMKTIPTRRTDRPAPHRDLSGPWMTA